MPTQRQTLALGSDERKTGRNEWPVPTRLIHHGLIVQRFHAYPRYVGVLRDPRTILGVTGVP